VENALGSLLDRYGGAKEILHMRGWLASLTVLSICSIDCGTHPIAKRGSKNAPCNPDGDCAPGLACVSDVCVSAVAGASTGTGGYAGSRAVDGNSGGGWAGSSNTGGSGADSGGSRALGGNAGTLVTGGIPFTAGTYAQAGTTIVGGNRDTGGMAITGGSRVTGGTATTGGDRDTGATTSVVGGTTASSSPPWTGRRPSGYVYISDGMAVDFMDGKGWVALGSQDTLTTPTCDASGPPITSANPCNTRPNWGSRTSLWISGNLPALPASPTQSDYDNNWGVRLGVNARDPIDSIGPDISYFTTVAFSFNSEPKTGWRAFVHRKGDPDAVTYCIDNIVPFENFSLSKFNTKCWGDPTSVHLTPADLPSIDQIGLSLSSSSSPITFDLVFFRISFYE
jgi:hypothetical protein